VSAGDLTLDLGGTNAFGGSASGRVWVHLFMANVEGDVKIQGQVHFDTLRIYASGTVSLKGNVTADFVEIFGLAGVAVAGEASLSGSLLSKQNVEVLDHAKMKFPSFAMAVGYRGNHLALLEKSEFEGAVLAPAGTVDRDSSAVLLDSSKALLPFCMDSRLVVFGRRRL
jgi:cytoskeletal protein CcmA (bactofilin family)